MADREKVIRGLERCLKHTCPAIDSKEYRDCEYTIGLYCGQDKLMRDAKSMLKEQDETIKELQNAYAYLQKQFFEVQDKLLKEQEQEAEWIEYPECLAYDGAYSDSHIVCSACNHVFSTMDNCTEEFDYCPHCGAKMRQEGR